LGEEQILMLAEVEEHFHLPTWSDGDEASCRGLPMEAHKPKSALDTFLSRFSIKCFIFISSHIDQTVHYASFQYVCEFQEAGTVNAQS
jgi:hypothetical protein